MAHVFETWTHADVADLIRAHPVAWIVVREADARAVLCPMLVECDQDGAPVSLLGHIPKRSPLADVFKTGPLATFLFLGPHGYISPEHLSNRDWAPTWNYASAQIDGAVELDDALTKPALERLVDHMERSSAQPWRVAELGGRYDVLRSRVIGFRARIVSMHARFKLGQDENETAFDEITDGLGTGDLSDWMRRFRR